MSQKQAQSETKYRLLVLILKNLIEEGHITEEKIKSIRKAISKKYRLPVRRCCIILVSFSADLGQRNDFDHIAFDIGVLIQCHIGVIKLVNAKHTDSAGTAIADQLLRLLFTPLEGGLRISGAQICQNTMVGVAHQKVIGAGTAQVRDLKYGRTVHSLLQAMSHFHPTFHFVAPESLQMPAFSVHCPTVQTESPEQTAILYYIAFRHESYVVLHR